MITMMKIMLRIKMIKEWSFSTVTITLTTIKKLITDKSKVLPREKEKKKRSKKYLIITSKLSNRYLV